LHITLFFLLFAYKLSCINRHSNVIGLHRIVSIKEVYAFHIAREKQIKMSLNEK